MIKIEYCKDGKAFSDFEAEGMVRTYCDINNKDPKTEIVLKVSTENFINAMRLMIIEKQIHFDDVVFIYENKTMQLNHFGNPNNWEKGFCEENHRITVRIVRGQCELRKSLRVQTQES